MKEHKTALVTGASRGIGSAIARKLAAQGFMVIVNYNGSEEKAEETVADISEAGGTAVKYKCDVADYKAVEIMIREVVKTYGSVDVLVNNAGITRDNLVMKMSEQEYEQVLDVNLKGCFHTIRHVSRQMLRQRSGRIINIASVSGISGIAGQANYSAAKAGMIGMTKAVAKELGGRGITVNAVAPGFIETDMTESLGEGVRTEAISRIALRRFGKAEEVAEAVSFLASDGAAYITGQIIQVDGGMV